MDDALPADVGAPVLMPENSSEFSASSTPPETPKGNKVQKEDTLEYWKELAQRLKIENEELRQEVLEWRSRALGAGSSHGESMRRAAEHGMSQLRISTPSSTQQPLEPAKETPRATQGSQLTDGADDDDIADTPSNANHRRRQSAVKIQSLFRAGMVRRTMEKYRDRKALLQRNELLKELLESEDSYIAGLHVIVDRLLRPLRAAADSRAPIVAHGDIEKLFSNVETLLEMHNMIHADMKERMSKWPNVEIGELFVRMAPVMVLYSSYVNNYQSMLLTLIQLRERIPPFRQFVEKFEASDEAQGLSVSGYLIQPVQRLPRYAMLLKSLLKYTPEDEAEHAHIARALRKVETIVDHINERKREAENLQSVFTIMQSFVGRHSDRVREVLQPHRVLVHEGELMQSKVSKLVSRYVFLFNDFLLIGAPARRERFLGWLRSSGSLTPRSDPDGELHRPSLNFKFAIGLADAQIEDLQDTETLKNAFKVSTYQEDISLVASSPAAKAQWLEQLRKIFGDAGFKRRKIAVLRQKTMRQLAESLQSPRECEGGPVPAFPTEPGMRDSIVLDLDLAGAMATPRGDSVPRSSLSAESSTNATADAADDSEDGDSAENESQETAVGTDTPRLPPIPSEEDVDRWLDLLAQAADGTLYEDPSVRVTAQEICCENGRLRIALHMCALSDVRDVRATVSDESAPTEAWGDEVRREKLAAGDAVSFEVSLRLRSLTALTEASFLDSELPRLVLALVRGSGSFRQMERSLALPAMPHRFFEPVSGSMADVLRYWNALGSEREVAFLLRLTKCEGKRSAVAARLRERLNMHVVESSEGELIAAARAVVAPPHFTEHQRPRLLSEDTSRDSFSSFDARARSMTDADANVSYLRDNNMRQKSLTEREAMEVIGQLHGCSIHDATGQPRAAQNMRDANGAVHLRGGGSVMFMARLDIDEEDGLAQITTRAEDLRLPAALQRLLVADMGVLLGYLG